MPNVLGNGYCGKHGQRMHIGKRPERVRNRQESVVQEAGSIGKYGLLGQNE